MIQALFKLSGNDPAEKRIYEGIKKGLLKFDNEQLEVSNFDISSDDVLYKEMFVIGNKVEMKGDKHGDKRQL